MGNNSGKQQVFQAVSLMAEGTPEEEVVAALSLSPSQAAEARFILAKRRLRGELPGKGGFANIAHAQEVFMALSSNDRIKLLNWATTKLREISR